MKHDDGASTKLHLVWAFKVARQQLPFAIHECTAHYRPAILLSVLSEDYDHYFCFVNGPDGKTDVSRKRRIDLFIHKRKCVLHRNIQETFKMLVANTGPSIPIESLFYDDDPVELSLECGLHGNRRSEGG